MHDDDPLTPEEKKAIAGVQLLNKGLEPRKFRHNTGCLMCFIFVLMSLIIAVLWFFFSLDLLCSHCSVGLGLAFCVLFGLSSAVSS